MKKGKVAVIMGSQSDYETMEGAIKILQEFKIETEVKIEAKSEQPKPQEENKQKSKEQQQSQQQLSKCEKQIEKLESQLKELDAKLADPDQYQVATADKEFFPKPYARCPSRIRRNQRGRQVRLNWHNLGKNLFE